MKSRIRSTRAYARGWYKYSSDVFVYRAIEEAIKSYKDGLIAQAGLVPIPLSRETKDPKERAAAGLEWARFFNVNPTRAGLWDEGDTPEMPNIAQVLAEDVEISLVEQVEEKESHT